MLENAREETLGGWARWYVVSSPTRGAGCTFTVTAVPHTG
jgi:hypothetical protein